VKISRKQLSVTGSEQYGGLPPAFTPFDAAEKKLRFLDQKKCFRAGPCEKYHQIQW
jgi:hypothetical protein